MLDVECEVGSELNACVEILNKTLCEAESGEEVSILEDIYQMDTERAFERYNAIMLGIDGLRLDLFDPSYKVSKTGKEEEEENGIPEEETKEDLD